MAQTKTYRKPCQDRFTATLWLDNAIQRSKSLCGRGNLAYGIFSERMIKDKYRIEFWQIEYIREAFSHKPLWATLKYNELLAKHK